VILTGLKPKEDPSYPQLKVFYLIKVTKSNVLYKGSNYDQNTMGHFDKVRFLDQQVISFFLY
jgi:hypothetical protein